MGNGEQTDIGILYRTYRTPLYAYLLGISRDPDIAEDITQETFIRIQKSFHTFDPSRGGFLNWAKVIGKNLYIRYKNAGSEKIPRDSSSMDKLADEREEVVESLEKKQAVEVINSAIECLPEPERSIIKYKNRNSLTLDEIADRLQISRRTVSRRYLKALELMKVELLKRGLSLEL